MRSASTQSASEPSPAVGEFRAVSGPGVYLAVIFGLAWLIELGPVRMQGLTSATLVMTLMVGAVFCSTEARSPPGATSAAAMPTPVCAGATAGTT